MARKRPKLKTVGRYMILNGEKVELDLTKTDLADRCKLALAEMMTGNKYELVPNDKDSQE